eukprot:Em0009g226a
MYSDDDKLKWQRGRPFESSRQTFETNTYAKKQLYVAELHTRERHRDEDWASYGDALRVLADKAYSDLEEKARERFSVHGMIGSNPHELLVDKGAAVSLLNASVWKGINNTKTHIVLQQWSGKKLVGVNGTPLSVKGLPLKKGVELAKMEIDEQDCLSTVSAPGKRKIEGVSSVDQETLWSLASKAGKHLNTQEKEQLFLLLPYPNYSKRFFLDTDASNYGIGAVLSRISNDGSECVIAYASRSLSRQEQRYCVTRRELLAIVEFVQHFRQYLLGRQFTLRTDHGSLVWVRHFKEPEGQLARWLERLEEYDFTVIHRRGSQHSNADALSPGPCAVTDMHFQTCSTEEMRHYSHRTQSFGKFTIPFEIEDSLLPDELSVLRRERCSEAVGGWCKGCIRCSTRKSSAPKRRAYLQTLRAGYPMQIVCVDIMGPLPETSKYVLVAADCFTKWVEAYGIPNQEAVTVAVKLVDEMFCRFYSPEQVHSDQGRQFESVLLKEVCNLLQIKKTHTTSGERDGGAI